MTIPHEAITRLVENMIREPLSRRAFKDINGAMFEAFDLDDQDLATLARLKSGEVIEAVRTITVPTPQPYPWQPNTAPGWWQNPVISMTRCTCGTTDQCLLHSATTHTTKGNPS